MCFKWMWVNKSETRDTHHSWTATPSDLRHVTGRFLTPSPQDERPNGTQEVQFPTCQLYCQQETPCTHGSSSLRGGQGSPVPMGRRTTCRCRLLMCSEQTCEEVQRYTLTFSKHRLQEEQRHLLSSSTWTDLHQERLSMGCFTETLVHRRLIRVEMS